MKEQETKRPRVAVPPPLIFGIPFVVGLGLQWVYPLRFPSLWVGLTLGVLCILPSLTLLVSARLAFRRSRNSMRYTSRSRVLILQGPFRYTRNPLFLGLLLLYAGTCFAVCMPWPLLFLPLVVALLHWVVILPEERFLEDRFGGEYRLYKLRVRRWI